MIKRNLEQQKEIIIYYEKAKEEENKMMGLVQLSKNFRLMTTFIILVIIGFIINLFDKKKTDIIGFTYKDYPHMKPIRIPTKGKGFWVR